MSETLNTSKISVIVPVYKVEPYLRRCVDSILAQTYTNLEIILVDDGSPDNCPAICDEYAKKDSRVRVIHKENGGLSDARNAGLNICTGEYIAFVDSDDWIEPDMYEKLLANMIQFGTEMSVGGVSDDVEENGNYRSVKVSDYGDKTFAESNVEAMKRYFLGSWAAWDKLYKASLFDGIRYPVGEINEDEAIVLQLLEKCSKVVYTNDVCYHYIRRPDSITTAEFNPKKLIWAKHCRDNLAWIREHHPELEPEAAARYCGCLVWLLTQLALCSGELKQSSRELLDELKLEYSDFRTLTVLSKTTRVHMALQKHLPFSIYSLLIKTWSKLHHG